MASIYKLVAERRDRNQSIKRKRNNRNINLFKDSIEEVQYRRPTLYRNLTLRTRTVSDQPHGHDLSLPPVLMGSRRGTNDLPMTSIKSQINAVDSKVDTLVKKIDELSNNIATLKMQLNKK
jgi:hypothetical protein